MTHNRYPELTFSAPEHMSHDELGLALYHIGTKTIVSRDFTSDFTNRAILRASQLFQDTKHDKRVNAQHDKRTDTRSDYEKGISRRELMDKLRERVKEASEQVAREIKEDVDGFTPPVMNVKDPTTHLLDGIATVSPSQHYIDSMDDTILEPDDDIDVDERFSKW